MKKFILVSTIAIVTTIATVFLYADKQNIKQLIFPKKEIVISKDSLLKLGMPERITEQYIIIRKSEKSVNKSFFIADTRENLIYFFDKKGNFVAKAPTIDGFDPQSIDKKFLDEAFKSWSEHAADIGFKYSLASKKYEDVWGKNRIYKHKLVYDQIAKEKGRFFPKGIYIIPSVYKNTDFVGNCKNTYNVKNEQGKDLALAIHGLYKSQFRINTMKEMIALIKTDFKEISAPKGYREKMAKNLRSYTYNNSYGCINVPEGFLLLTENLATGSLLIVLGEEEKDYLVAM
jgi:hypothetical protein